MSEVLEAWDLEPDGQRWNGYASLVFGVTTDDATPAALKIGFPHSESAHEHLALQHWHGDGSVRLLRADPGRGALLLERLHPRDLSEEWDLAACEVVGALYARLHRPAPPQLRRLSEECRRWARELVALPRDAPLPRRLVEQAAGLAETFAADPGTDGRLLHTDLHYENVLAADREPWLVIDPKPLSGDPAYEVAPLLWNRWDELAGDVRGGVRRRFHATIDAAGLDEDRARDWVVLRMLVNAKWALEDAVPDQGWLTRCVSVAKAVQE